jgi:predicted outer membrane lipoprotein
MVVIELYFMIAVVFGIVTAMCTEDFDRRDVPLLVGISLLWPASMFLAVCIVLADKVERMYNEDD